jgi:hypothetical protein
MSTVSRFRRRPKSDKRVPSEKEMPDQKVDGDGEGTGEDEDSNNERPTPQVKRTETLVRLFCMEVRITTPSV